MNDYCKYCQYINKGIECYFKCSISKKYCKFQKYCNTKKQVVHTEGWQNCQIFERKEGHNNGKK